MIAEIDDAIRGSLKAVNQGCPDGSWSEDRGREAFERLAAAGWLGVGVPAELGGAGGTARDAVAAIRAVTRVGWPSALADVGFVSGHVSAYVAARLPDSARPVLCLPVPGHLDEDGRVTVGPCDVPWAGWAAHFLVVCPSPGQGCVVALLDASSVVLAPGATMAGGSCGVVRAERLTPVWRTECAVDCDVVCGELRAAGALARAVQMAAALGRTVELSVAYSTQRTQFGRRLADFQAVQQHLATLAGEVAAADAAVDRALGRWLGVGSPLDRADVAVAKIRTGVAVERALPIAHQVHGAIGITREYELHRHSLSLWSWREEFGDERWWAELVVRELAASGADVWAWLTRD